MVQAARESVYCDEACLACMEPDSIPTACAILMWSIYALIIRDGLSQQRITSGVSATFEHTEFEWLRSAPSALLALRSRDIDFVSGDCKQLEIACCDG